MLPTTPDLAAAVERFREPTHVLGDERGQRSVLVGNDPMAPGWQVLATLPAIYPEWLGDRSFGEVHGVRFPYVVGEMANGIATVEMVIAAAHAGCLGFFGAAGLAPARVDAALRRLVEALGDRAPWGINLIHSPDSPGVEQAVVDLVIAHGVRSVSASAFLDLTPAVVQVSAAGLQLGADGSVQRARQVFAKVSRPEVARRFMEPPPVRMLDQLVAEGRLTAQEARLAAELPVAEDITVESDSGGHTDNRPLGALFPTLARLRDDVVAAHRYVRPIRLGAAGGLGTPSSLAAAFGYGAAYVVTGSVNQACVESGLHADARTMLAAADIADVVMAPAADMFELGVDVQVLKRGTMFGVRGRRLYELYRAHASLEDLPSDDRQWVEQQVLRATVGEAWTSTRAYWADRDPAQVARADGDGRIRMALVFRSYLGQASRWAIDGAADRRADFQIWCGPAMGAFNVWTAGTFLAEPAQRTVAQVAANLLEGAAACVRAHQLRTLGVPVPSSAFDPRPRPLVS